MLEEIILQIRTLPVEELEKISKNAIDTAKNNTDSIVAKQYLYNVNVLNE